MHGDHSEKLSTSSAHHRGIHSFIHSFTNKCVWSAWSVLGTAPDNPVPHPHHFQLLALHLLLEGFRWLPEPLCPSRQQASMLGNGHIGDGPLQ